MQAIYNYITSKSQQIINVDIDYKKDTVRLSIHKLNLYFLNLLKYKKIYI